MTIGATSAALIPNSPHIIICMLFHSDSPLSHVKNIRNTPTMDSTVDHILCFCILFASLTALVFFFAVEVLLRVEADDFCAIL